LNAPAEKKQPQDGTGLPHGSGHGHRQHPSEHLWRRNLYSLSAANLLASIGFSIAWPFLPLVVRSLGVRENLETWVGYMMLAFYVVGFTTSPIWGGVSDHYGRKPMVLRAMLGMGVMMSLLPFAPSPLVFAGLFILVGIFNGFNPAVAAMLTATVPPAMMGRAVSLAQTGTLVGQTVGPALGAILGGLLLAHHHVFWLSGAFLLAGGIVAAFFSSETHVRPAGPWRPRWVGSLRELLAQPGMPTVYLLCIVFGMHWHGNTPVITLFTLELLEARPDLAHGFGEAFWAGAMATGLAIASIAALVIGGRLLDRIGAPRVLTFCTAAAALTHAPLLVLEGPISLLVARVAFGLTVATMLPALYRAIKDIAPPGMDGRAIAYASSCQMIGMGSAPFLAGIVGPWLGLRTYFALGIVVSTLGLALLLRSPGLRGKA
jgi:DHA1 family multidrug resistance protein-like MFS transporter